jgi:predicted oxidoreductase
MAAVPTLSLHAEGPRVSRLVFGLWRLAAWNVDEQGLHALTAACVELGITTVDLADVYGDYGCEERFGSMLARAPSLRDRLQLVTKCGIKLVSEQRPRHGLKHYDTSGAHIVASVEHSLRMLRTDRIDLLLLHRPDPLLDADETAATLDALVRAGKVLHLGVSNFAPTQFDLLASRLTRPLVTNQIEISPLRLAPFIDGSLDHAQRLRIAPMAWSPLGGGRLFASDDPQAQRVRAALGEIGREIGAAADQVAFAWLLAHPARIVPVIGSGNLDRIRGAAGAVRVALTREQWFRIWTASAGQTVA